MAASTVFKVDEWGDPRPADGPQPPSPTEIVRELVLVRVRYSETPYMGDEVTRSEMRLVRVAAGENVYDKVAAHYDAMSQPYGTNYFVKSVEVMETIE